MSKWKWVVLLISAIFIDLVQLGLNLFAVGIAANRFIDTAVGVALVGFLSINGISVIEPKRLTSLIATFGFEMIPIIDTLPLWTLDVIYNWFITKSEDKIKEKVPGAAMAIRAAQLKRNPVVGDMDSDSDIGERRPTGRRVTIEE